MSPVTLLESLDQKRGNVHTAIAFDDGKTLTYRDLNHHLHKAVGLIQQLGLQEGDVLAIQAPRGLPLIITILGALQCGVTVLPLNTQYTPNEVHFYLEDASVKVAILLPEHAQALVDSAPIVLASTALTALLDKAAISETPAPAQDTLAFIIYTSGTTGRPKGAMIRHRNLTATVVALHTAWGWRQTDKLLHVLPLTHIHGLFVALFGAFYAGATVHLADRFEPNNVLRIIEKQKITLFMGVPTHYHRLLSAPIRPDLSSMRLFTSGSAPLPAKDHREFFSQFGHAVLERYGMTEVGIVLSNPLHGERIAGTVGKPLPGIQVRIVDPAGTTVPEGQVGQLQIRGPSVIDGYLGLPKATETAIKDGWMNSGDLATQTEGIYRIVGRATDMIISGGFNVYPREIETILLQLPEITEAAVVGFPDSDFGERVVAFLVPRTGKALNRDAIFRHINTNLAPYKRPKVLYQLDAFPRNSMGKVKKNALRARSQNPPPSI